MREPRPFPFCENPSAPSFKPCYIWAHARGSSGLNIVPSGPVWCTHGAESQRHKPLQLHGKAAGSPPRRASMGSPWQRVALTASCPQSSAKGAPVTCRADGNAPEEAGDPQAAHPRQRVCLRQRASAKFTPGAFGDKQLSGLISVEHCSERDSKSSGLCWWPWREYSHVAQGDQTQGWEETIRSAAVGSGSTSLALNRPALPQEAPHLLRDSHRVQLKVGLGRAKGVRSGLRQDSPAGLRG